MYVPGMYPGTTPRPGTVVLVVFQSFVTRFFIQSTERPRLHAADLNTNLNAVTCDNPPQIWTLISTTLLRLFLKWLKTLSNSSKASPLTANDDPRRRHHQTFCWTTWLLHVCPRLFSSTVTTPQRSSSARVATRHFVSPLSVLLPLLLFNGKHSRELRQCCALLSQTLS